MSDTNVINQFPHAVLTPLPTNDRPTRQILKLLHLEVNSNAASIYSARGNGDLGHLALVLPTAEFLVASGNQPFVIPANPGIAPVHAPNETQFVIAEVNRVYTNNINDFRLYKNVSAAIKKQLDFIEDLRHPTLGFANVTVLAILDHLDTTYGAITPDDLENNMALLHKEWNPTQSLETLFTQIRLCRLFAQDVEPISETFAVRAATMNLEKTGLFTDALREWRRRPLVEQTLVNLKADFTRADRERQRTTTAGSAGYHSVSTVVQQQASPPVTHHHAAAATNKENHPPPSTIPTYYYCWSHGYGPNSNHHGGNCKFSLPGHRAEATFFNMMSGCNKIHRKRSEVVVPRIPNLVQQQQPIVPPS